MMTYTYFVISFLLLWFCLSILNQLKINWFKALKYRDAFAMIPSWSFFAPNPGRTDYHLMYRNQLAVGIISPWKTIRLSGPPILKGIWHPTKRKHKAITDNVSEIKFLKVDYNSKSLEYTNAYLTLLAIVMQEPHIEDAHKTQFAIMETFGHYNPAQPNPVLLSNWHKL